MPSEIERALARRESRRGAAQAAPAPRLPRAEASHAALVEMNRALTATLELRPALRGALEILNRNPLVARSAVTLAVPELAEVVVNGAREPSHARAPDDGRIVCTTVRTFDRPIGALAVDLTSASDEAREQIEYTIHALAELIAHAVHIRQLLTTQPDPTLAARGDAPPPTRAVADADQEVALIEPSESLADLVSGYEKRLIESALRTTRGNRARAAKLLQTTERIVGYRVQQYGIDCRAYRD